MIKNFSSSTQHQPDNSSNPNSKTNRASSRTKKSRSNLRLDSSNFPFFVPNPKSTDQKNFLFEFWNHVIRSTENYQSDFKDSQIPLARIKKLLKTDPEIRMIANEVIVLLDKACQIFVNEITVRAFLVATSSNRRTINTSDIASAVSQSDMFDFLIDIVPPVQQISPEMTKPQGGSRIESQQRGNNKRTNPEQSINKDSNQSKKTRTNQCKTERVEMPSIGSRASVQLDDPSILKSSPSSIDKTRSWELAVPLESDSSPKDLDEVISEDEKPMIKLEEEKEDEQGNDQGIGWERAVPICERERESSLSLSTNGWDLAERVASDEEEEEEEEEEEDEFEDDERKIADRFGLRDRSTGVTDWEIAVPLDRDSDENESENEAETEKEEAGELTRGRIPIDPCLMSQIIRVKSEE